MLVNAKESVERKTSLASLLDETHELLTTGQIEEGMEKLYQGLRERRMQATQAEWAEFVRVCVEHPVRQLLHLDPLSWRAFHKPRGYAGDAELLDIVYGVEDGRPLPAKTTTLGKRICSYTTGTPGSHAVRNRRRLLASTIDSVAQRTSRARILSLAAGHLREAELSAAVLGQDLADYVAIDQDRQSLAVVNRCYSRYGVRSVCSSVRRLLVGSDDLGLFDLVYAAGLYDYLAQQTAERLTHSLFRMLRPGGQLLIANFVPGIFEVGYLESYMGWNLIYRTPEELRDTAASIPPSEFMSTSLFLEESKNIAFLRITRAG